MCSRIRRHRFSAIGASTCLSLFVYPSIAFWCWLPYELELGGYSIFALRITPCSQPSKGHVVPGNLFRSRLGGYPLTVQNLRERIVSADALVQPMGGKYAPDAAEILGLQVLALCNASNQLVDIFPANATCVEEPIRIGYEMLCSQEVLTRHT